MKRSLLNRNRYWLTTGALFALAADFAVTSQGQQPTPAPAPDVLYYHLTKVDTDVDYYSSNPDLQKKQSGVAVNGAGSGEIEVKLLLYDLKDSYWRINPGGRTATFYETRYGTKDGLLQLNWSPLPEYLYAGEDVQLSATIAASRSQSNTYINGAASFRDTPIERFTLDGPGGPPWYKDVVAGQMSSGWIANGTGSVQLKPKKNAGSFVVYLGLQPSCDGAYNIRYHYDPMPAGSPRPKGNTTIPATPKTTQGNATPPPKTTRCPYTFGKAWTTSWGQFAVNLNGSNATGTYTNRDGNNGPGTFTGTVSGNALNTIWKDNSGKFSGTFNIVLSDDGCSFTNPSFTITPTPPTGTAIGPTGTDSNSNGGLPTDPCLNPTAQHCIDLWLAKWVALMNQTDPTNAPYSISKYGTFTNRNTISNQPPEGWETTYHSNKYCYVWNNYAKENLDPRFQGQLPALQTFVANCYSNSVGSTAPNPPIGTNTSGNPPTSTTIGPTSTTPIGPDTPVSSMTLLADKWTVQPGGLVSVPVWLRQGTDVASLNYTVNYDASVAVPEGNIIPGSLLGSSLFSANPNTPGIIRLGVAGGSGMNGDGTVATVPFRATGPVGASTVLHLTVSTCADSKQGKMPIATIDGAITIVGPNGRVKGDCNGDGVVDARDAQCALDLSTQLISPDLNLDMDNDGQVTVIDATLILQQTKATLLLP